MSQEVNERSENPSINTLAVVWVVTPSQEVNERSENPSGSLSKVSEAAVIVARGE